MNHIFSLVWSAAAGQWIPASEHGHRNRPGRSRTARTSLAGAALCLVGLAQAGPQGAQVTAGAGTVTHAGTTTTVRQGGQTLDINWLSFNVAKNETVDFIQPGASAIAINRILGGNGSEILGHVNANGQVWLINPNGVLFGPGAQINVAGLVAST